MPEPYVRFLCQARYPQWVEEMPTPFEIPQVKVGPDGLLRWQAGCGRTASTCCSAWAWTTCPGGPL